MDRTARTRGTRFGAFEVDLRSGELHKHGIRLKLQDQPFRVLALLLEHSGDVVTREELFDAVSHERHPPRARMAPRLANEGFVGDATLRSRVGDATRSR